MAVKGAQARERNPNWQGGRSVRAYGYVIVKQPEHPRADSRGYVYEHIIVAEEMLGRALLPGEEVHHRDENPSNNARENLEVKATRRDHALAHRKRTDLRMPGEENPLVECACKCGRTFRKYDRAGRPRRYASGHNPHGEGGRYGR